MWDSKESVYKIIKPPQAFKPRTPPPTAKELRDRKVEKITRRLKLMMRQKSAATMGKPGGHYKPCVRNFLKKHSKEPVIVYGKRSERQSRTINFLKALSISESVQELSENVEIDAEQQRCTKHVKRFPDVPRDKPVYGRVKILDFIKMNAEQMIHSKPDRSKCQKKQRRYLLKKSFGKLPAYLTSRMKESAAKKKKDSPEEKAKAAAACKHEGTRKLDEKERITMMNNLKLKWADTNARYQRLSVALDLDSQKRQKERFEENLTRLEKDVSLLSRKVILVSDTAPPKVQKEVTTPKH